MRKYLDFKFQPADGNNPNNGDTVVYGSHGQTIAFGAFDREFMKEIEDARAFIQEMQGGKPVMFTCVNSGCNHSHEYPLSKWRELECHRCGSEMVPPSRHSGC